MTPLQLAGKLRATEGWVTKFRKKAEFWEAEARRLGSTSQYKIYDFSGDGHITIGPQQISMEPTTELLKEADIEVSYVSEWSEPMPRDAFAALKGLVLEDVPRETPQSVKVIVNPTVEETTKRRFDVSQFELPPNFRIAPHTAKFGPIHYRKCINVLTGEVGIIKRGIKAAKGSRYPHKAYCVLYGESNEFVYELSKDIWILERIR
jgi:hypothetical protein